MTTMFSPAHGHMDGCVHLPNKTRVIRQLYKEIYQEYFLGYPTFNVIPEYRDAVRRHYASLQTHMPFEEHKIRNRQIYGSSACPRSRRHAPEEVKSPCPHHVVLNVDRQREPRNIAKAKCNCHRCLNIDHESKVWAGTGTCKPVSSFIPVIRWKCPRIRTGNQTYYTYVIEMEEVPIGCTCERARSVRRR